MKTTEEYIKEELEEFDTTALIDPIVKSPGDSALWYELFKATEKQDIEISKLNLPELADLSKEYNNNDVSMFAINQAIVFCKTEVEKEYYVVAKCRHISISHTECYYDYNRSAPHLPFLNEVLALNLYNLVAVEAKISILRSSPPPREEYNSYKAWVLENMKQLTSVELPPEFRTERIGAVWEELLSDFKDSLGYDDDDYDDDDDDGYDDDDYDYDEIAIQNEQSGIPLTGEAISASTEMGDDTHSIDN